MTVAEHVRPALEPELSRPDAARPARSSLLIVGALALVVAAYVVSRALLLERFPWFVDEANFGIYTQATLGDRASRFIALMDHKGLLNAWIGALIMKFGFDSVEALRLLAGASGLLTALATGVLVRRWLGSRQGAAAAALTLFVPWLFVQNAVGVHDSLVAALSMLALVLQLSLARRPRLDTALLLGFAVGALLLTKPTGVLAIALLPASLLVFDWAAPRRGRRLLEWAWLGGVSVVVAGVIFGITRLSPLAYTPAPDNHRTIGQFLDDPFGALTLVGGDVASGMLGYLTLPIAAAALWGMVRAIRTRDATGLVLTIWALAATAAFLLLTTRGFPRYGIQAAAPLCALAVLGGADLFARVQRRWSRGVAIAVAAFALLPALILDARVVAKPDAAPYPGLDHAQYVTSASNIEPDRAAARAMLAATPEVLPADYHAYDTTMLVNTGWKWQFQLELNGRTLNPHPRWAVFEPWAATPEQGNLFRWVVIESGTATPDWLDLSKAKVVGRWQRPDGGETTTLYARGTIASRGLL